MKPIGKILFMAILGLSFCGLVYSEDPQSGDTRSTYYSSGELKYTSQYKEGKLDGLTKEYNKAGDIIQKYLFKKDILVGRYQKNRDYGQFSIFTSYKFWIVFIFIFVGVWFLWTKLFLRRRSF